MRTGCSIRLVDASGSPIAQLGSLAELLRERNRLDSKVAEVIGRPALTGHIGEFIASVIFDIDLHPMANAAASDGVFAAGMLKGATVNIKFYGKDHGLLDLPSCGKPTADYILVLAGRRSSATSSKGQSPPIQIQKVYLFQSTELLDTLHASRTKIGVATSVKRSLWDAAEIYPSNGTALLELDERQRDLLPLFSTGR